MDSTEDSRGPSSESASRYDRKNARFFDDDPNSREAQSIMKTVQLESRPLTGNSVTFQDQPEEDEDEESFEDDAQLHNTLV